MGGRTRVTQIDVPRDTYLRYNILQNLRTKKSLAKGLIKHTLRRPDHTFDGYARFKAQREKGPLSEQEIAAQEAFEVSKSRNAEQRSAIELTPSLEAHPDRQTMQQRGAFLLKSALEMHEGVRRIANIGARVDVAFSFLAPLFPKIEFISVDFQKDLVEINSLLEQSPNWSFRSGYGLDLMKRGELDVDACFFTSTSVLFRWRELEEYLQELSRVASLLVFNEPWWPRTKSLRLMKIPLPEEIDPRRPISAGLYGNYHHNYVYWLQRFGYEIELSRIVPGGSAGYYALQIVATKPGR